MRLRRAQSTLEYAVIVAVVIGALLFMSTYIRRSVQGKYRESADDMGDQFDPYKTNSEYTSVSISHQKEDTVSGVLEQETQNIGSLSLDPLATHGVDVSPYDTQGEVQIIVGEETLEAYE